MFGIFGSFGVPYRRESCGVNRAWTAWELQDDIAALNVILAQKYALCDASYLCSCSNPKVILRKFSSKRSSPLF